MRLSWSGVVCVGCLPSIEASLDPGPPVTETEPSVVIVVPTGTTPPVVDPDTSDTAVPEPPPPPPPVAEITVDATDHERWVGLDLDAFAFDVDVDGPAWDLRFRRFEVATNGGASGAGTVEIAALDGVPFEEVLEVPAGVAWRTDAPDADGDGAAELALADWYLYDEVTHELTAADRTYLVRTTDDVVYRLAFLSYYDPAGTPAKIALRTGPLAAP